ncbi:MAG TPA: hypothetical protein VJK04_04295 [Candidatus Paceibacterota bacterium]
MKEDFGPEGNAAGRDPEIGAFINSLSNLDIKEKLALFRQSKFPGIKNRLQTAKERWERGSELARNEAMLIIEAVLNDIKDMDK